MKISKKRVFDIIQIGNRNDLPSRLFDFFIVCVIIINIAVLFLGTFEELNELSSVFRMVELVTILIFCLEYGLRIWTAEYLYPDISKQKAVITFLFSPDGLVDLFTILPFFFLSGFVALRMLRVVRIFHLFRINAQYDSFHVITSVLRDKKNQIISSVFIILILMMASSLCMYSAEHDAQPEIFNNAFSGMWWSISTILTVGYGDIYPVTVMGRLMAIVIALLGVGVVAIPTGIISAGFVEQYTEIQRKNKADAHTKGIVTVSVNDESPFWGESLEKMEQKYHIHAVVVIREDMIILPKGDMKLCKGDQLIYQSESLLEEG